MKAVLKGSGFLISANPFPPGVHRVVISSVVLTGLTYRNLNANNLYYPNFNVHNQT